MVRKALSVAAKKVNGVAFLGQTFTKMGHTPIAPDNGKAMDRLGCMGITGHKRTLLSGALRRVWCRDSSKLDVTVQDMQRSVWG
jgi:hypothetical protein